MATYPSGSRYQNKLFHNLPLGMVFYHNNRKMTNVVLIQFLCCLLTFQLAPRQPLPRSSGNWLCGGHWLFNHCVLHEQWNEHFSIEFLCGFYGNPRPPFLLFPTPWHCAQVPSIPSAYGLLRFSSRPPWLSLPFRFVCWGQSGGRGAGNSVSIFSSHSAPSDYLWLWHHPSSQLWIELLGRFDRLFLCTPLPCSSLSLLAWIRSSHISVGMSRHQVNTRQNLLLSTHPCSLTWDIIASPWYGTSSLFSLWSDFHSSLKNTKMFRVCGNFPLPQCSRNKILTFQSCVEVWYSTGFGSQFIPFSPYPVLFPKLLRHTQPLPSIPWTEISSLRLCRCCLLNSALRDHPAGSLSWLHWNTSVYLCGGPYDSTDLSLMWLFAYFVPSK